MRRTPAILWSCAKQNFGRNHLRSLRPHSFGFSTDTHLLWKGVQSTSFSGHLEFKDGSESTFPVFQVLNSRGELQDGVDLPFSLEEGVQMMELMVKSKVYDDVLLTMQRQGRISFYCTNYGEEATSVGTAAALQPQDMIWPQYRELGAFLWRGLTAQEIADQNIGNEGDRSKGRNLQVHYCMLEKNMQTVHAVLGTQVPQAPGAGYAYKLDGEDRVSVAYFGDGAASEGDALTALNFASVYGSQTLFIVRNNGYSISTGVEDQYRGDGIAARGPAFAIPTVRVDGNDLVAVFLATQEARKRSIENKQPILLELMTYRVGDHTTSDDSSAYRKEDKEEIKQYQSLGPIPRWRAFLESKGMWSDEKEKAIASAARDEMLQAMKSGETKKKPPLRELFTDVYTDLPWHLEEQAAYAEKHCREYSSDYKMSAYRGLDGPAPATSPQRIASAPRHIPPAPPKETQEMTMVQAINDALSVALASSERSVLFGEDVGFGGVFRCSVGLREKFGEHRVMNAPVAEQAIAGFAVGLSVAGYKAIAEMQFADYIFPAFDQIVNEIAKYRYRNAGGGAGNITIRAPCSAVGHGSMYHSQSVESYFAHCPGLKIIIPRGPKQAKGLLLAAIRDPDPVLFFEPKVLYRAKIEGPDSQVPVGDYELPIGQAEVVQEGKDVTLVGWGSQIGRLQAAAARAAADGISCEVIDLQTIIPWDVDTVQASVQKTGRLIIAHEAPQTNGFGAEISAKIQERCFLHLQSPIQRVCGYDTHFPYAWEEFYVPSPARVLDAIKASVAY
ncbi:2-oxoisovalerate dehydrogenase subunit beta [Durusdinium trenchii]|uniref:3-methyl-2-oxobutanoate dehydrogenase (2-methylpropanoyl-transferring) n=1 Tax=Durusdinium trenchii TaxID=1381693 RepID=A0ABP0MYE9_9DINO